MTIPFPDARMLIAVRVVVVTSLLLALLIVQYTVGVILPLDYLYLITGVAYALTIGYIVLARFIRSREVLLYVQLAGDLFVESLLVYFTGGLDSPFSFLYLVSIITGSMLLYRRGGLIVASGAAIVYGTLVDLMYYEVIPRPLATFFTATAPWTAARLYLNLITNFAGFYAAALLTSYLSEKLRRTALELDANRQNLAELEALNQNVIESIPSGLMTITRAGFVSFINPAGCEILRTTPEAIIGRRVTASGLLSEAEWNEMSDAIAGQRVVRGEKNQLAVAGEERSIGYALTPLNTLEGHPSGLTLIFQDLTEMKKLEAQLRLKDRMAAVGELSAGIAHEIRNPLAAIAGSVQMLRKSDRLTHQEQRLMTIILKESDRLNQSIADFLRFVRPQEKVSSDFDIAAALSETLDLLRHSLELGPQHQIERAIDPPSFLIHGDQNQIRQVFWNIAKNAFQAMPDGGTLRVSTERQDGVYRIAFTDSGHGITEADQRRLFQPFRTNFPSGTGLGMAISYRIVQEHGGRIEVDTRVGAGTSITIVLPAVAAAAVVRHQSPVAS